MIVPPRLRPAVSEYVGIVPHVEGSLAGTTDSRLRTCVCSLASDRRVLGSRLDHVDVGGGAGRTDAAAAGAAVGEALERYSATYVPATRLVHATAAELGPDAVAPERFALFAEHQHAEPGFPFVPFTSGTRVPWVEGRALRDGRRAFLPAELVFLGDVVDDGPRVGYATSSGAAAAADPGEAVFRGLCELLERDAFMLVWRNRLSLPLLDWRTHPKLRALDDRYFAPAGLETTAVDLSCVHGLPSVLGIVRSPDGLGVGAGTAATVARAWWKALEEAFGAHAGARRMAALGLAPVVARDIVDVGDHVAWYGDPERARAADFLDASTVRVDVREVRPLDGRDTASRVAALLDRVERAGSDAYVVEVTSPDVARLGLRVVKTVAPELCALDVPHRVRFLGGRRVLHAAHDLGLLPRPLEVHELNPDPHPFP